jgi:hypothetical protein
MDAKNLKILKEWNNGMGIYEYTNNGMGELD